MGKASGIQRTPTLPPFELPPIAALQVSSEVAPEEEIDTLDKNSSSEAVAKPSSYSLKKVDWAPPKGLFLPSPLPRDPSLLATSEDDILLLCSSVSRGSKHCCVTSSDAERKPSGEVQGNTPAKLIVQIPVYHLAVAQPRPLSMYAFAPVVLTGRVRCRYFFLEFL